MCHGTLKEDVQGNALRDFLKSIKGTKCSGTQKKKESWNCKTKMKFDTINIGDHFIKTKGDLQQIPLQKCTTNILIFDRYYYMKKLSTIAAEYYGN